MPYFITRIELHSAVRDAYTRLHAEMANEGFTRNIKGSDNVLYDLPTASYCKIGNYQIADVLLSAKRAAVKVDTDYEVLVTQAAEISGETKITWYNLRRSI